MVKGYQCCTSDGERRPSAVNQWEACGADSLVLSAGLAQRGLAIGICASVDCTKAEDFRFCHLVVPSPKEVRYL